MPPSSMPLGERGQVERGQALGRDLVGEGAARGRPARRGRAPRRAARPRSGRWRAPPRRRGRRAPASSTRSGSRAASLEQRLVDERLAHLVDDDRAEAEAGLRQLADASARLLHGHLLEEGDDVDHALAVAQHPGDRLGLRVDRPHLGEVGDLDVDVEEAGHAPVGGASRTTASHALGPWPRRWPGGAADRLVDLAGEEHVAHPGRDGRREVDDAHPLQGAAGAAELVERCGGTRAARPWRRPTGPTAHRRRRG